MHDCSRCHENPELRRMWGCDGPTAYDEGVTQIDCVVCSGRDAACVHCKGLGSVEILRCPWKLIEDSHIDCVRAGLHVENGVLPAPGAWHDQSTTFVEAYPFVANEIARWREIAHKRAVEEANRNSK